MNADGIEVSGGGGGGGPAPSEPSPADSVLAGASAAVGAAGQGAAGADASLCGNGAIEAGETCDGNCPTDCVRPANACVENLLVGDSATCTAQCVPHDVSACTSGDACCPSGCRYPADSDCSKSCGDGVVDAPETCEPGTARDCPGSCDDANPCTTDVKTGSAETCSVACAHMPVTRPANGDGCCPSSANANNDSDCTSRCGNGVLEPGETCDGNCARNCDDRNPCTSDTLEGSPTACNVACRNTTITAPRSGDGCCPIGANANNDNDCAPACLNGVVERGETCDGNCRTTCDDGDPCTRETTVGSARTCDLACDREVIEAVGMNDGCCPSAATWVSDVDCPNTCGNGELDPGELCDGTSCPDPAHPEFCELDPCVTYEILGGPCLWKCVLQVERPRPEFQEVCDMFLAALPTYWCKGGTPTPDILKACDRHGVPWVP